ncbi:hypothetical protein [Actinoplanes sp. NPDC048796]|uniref:hypothetical protein n=1 Tax=Actinoplanes sp. NPDC048796 TaxID=3155640 RepID=UPI0033F07C73
MLAEHANPDGADARPSPLRIRFATGFDVRTIDRALQRLMAEKLILKDGRHYSGTQRWRLALDRKRPETFWDDLVAEDEKARKVESDARQRRRVKEKARLSGTQNAGHIEADVSMAEPVRDANSRTPGFSVPDAGTQNAGRRDVKSGSRDATPSEPPEPPGNHPKNPPGTIPGGTLPPDPLRPPSPSAPGHEQKNSLSEPLTPAQDQEGESLPHASTREAGPDLRLVPGTDQSPPGPKQRGIFPAAVPTPGHRRTRAEEAIAEAAARRAAAVAAHQARKGTA